MTTKQTSCGRTACDSKQLDYYNVVTQKKYCSPCASRINYFSVLDHGITLCLHQDELQWTAQSLAQARSEGWTVMEHGDTLKLMIAKVDDACEPGDKVCFRWDDDAQAHVNKQAQQGNALATAALLHIAASNKD